MPPAVVAQPKKISPIRSAHALPSAHASRVEVAPLAASLPTIAQPDLPDGPIVNLSDTLPPVPTGELPPLPVTSTATSADVPGGSVLVLEMFLNDEAVVVDARILVPSANALSDLALTFSALGQKWTGIAPPLQQGERRRLELRIPYADQALPPSIP
ncbi:MAG: hypothetical protein Q7U16_01800 [Agitococcus sp.]|nr:hypothetical protein [Agitococcus sp.]